MEKDSQEAARSPADGQEVAAGAAVKQTTIPVEDRKKTNLIKPNGIGVQLPFQEVPNMISQRTVADPEFLL